MLPNSTILALAGNWHSSPGDKRTNSTTATTTGPQSALIFSLRGASTRRGGAAARAGSAGIFSGHRVGSKLLRAAIVTGGSGEDNQIFHFSFGLKTAQKAKTLGRLVPHPVTLQFPFEAVAPVAAGGGDRASPVCEVLGVNLRPATDSEATGKSEQPAVCIGDW
ncbi:Hypothetical predicted protein [Olea europaea subsp. europaea]|uniref:Uncharacterized protein n=1 Tax=Olea europaea subsp. europaea TaxID=158383 RepID=A0A8S0U7L7_OLEEU|nr:Hypothetical predicted protein [Olea europaea subsp. europaea]